MPRPRTNAAERAELRRMLAELDCQQFEAGGMVRRALEPGERRETGGYAQVDHGIRASHGNYDVTITGVIPNAPVWADICQHARKTISGKELRRKVWEGLNGGFVSVWYRHALAVARLRLAGSYRVSPPILPPDAGLGEAEKDRQAYLRWAFDVDRAARDWTRLEDARQAMYREYGQAAPPAYESRVQ